MAYTELAQKIIALGYMCSYGGRFLSPPNTPYAAIMFYRSADVMADNKNLVDVGYYALELYNDKKEKSVEAQIENVLKELRLPYHKSETWIEDEQLFMTNYEFSLIGG